MALVAVHLFIGAEADRDAKGIYPTALSFLIYFFPRSCAVNEIRQTNKQKSMGMSGYLAVSGKFLVVLGLKLLFLVPAGVPARSGDSALKDNITVRQGDSAVLK